MITQARLKELLRYEPETGNFIWLVARGNKAYPGRIAGKLDERGYRRITIDGKAYRAHKLAVLYMTGEWPSEQIDHDDTNKDNNRWGNLREANDSQNQSNKGLQKNNATGFKGVSFHTKHNQYRAVIYKDGKQIHLGYFATAELAGAAYAAAAPIHHGEFARLSSTVTEGRCIGP